jgi:DNA-binding ferritin-like protein
MENEDYLKSLVERHKKQLERVRKYYSEHRDEQNAKSRAYFQKIKADPEKYKLYLENKKKKYLEKNPKS